MRPLTTAIALMLCAALLFVPSSDAEAQDGDSVSITTKMILTALDSLDGSGQVQYRFEGAAALDLRQGVITSYDSSRNLALEANEALRFLSDLGDEMEGRMYWGVTILNPTNYSAMTESEVVNRTTGLVGSVLSSPEPVEFGYDFDAGGEVSSRLLSLSELSARTFLGSVETVAGYTFEGMLKLSDRVTVFGVSSYTSPDLIDGTISELRTPLGSVMWYSFTAELGPALTINSEAITFEWFNWLENQQIAFVVLVIGCLLIMRTPAKRYEKYKLEHPKKYRKSAKPLASVRVFSWSMLVLLSVLYLLPSLLSSFDRNMLIYSSYLYLLVPSAVIGTHFFTRSMYARASTRIPEDVVIEVKQAYVGPEAGPGDVRCQICMMPLDAEVDMYQCSCGFSMHNACAHRSQTCPLCGTVLFPEQTRSVECRACKETFLTSVEEDPFLLQCTKCGAFQEEIKVGKNYLVVDVDGKRAYNMLRSMGMSGRPAMVLTSEFPGKVREEHSLGDDFEVKWFSETTGDIDSVDIKGLEADAMETISTFLMTTKRAGLLLDCVESVISKNSFDEALAFIKRVNDLAKVHGASVIMWFDRERIPEGQAKSLSDEFDEVHDYL